MKRSYSSGSALVICDLRGTLTHGEPLLELVKAMLPQAGEIQRAAEAVIQRLEDDEISLAETLGMIAGLCKNGKLRKAVEYATFKMKLVNGFDQFVDCLHKAGIGLAIITPLFGVLTETLRNIYGHDRFRRIISNPLQFALDGDPRAAVDDSRLCRMIERFFIKARDHKAFDRMQATGKVSLVLDDESRKAELVGKIANSLKVPLEKVAYLASQAAELDVMAQVISHGGKAIAFNYHHRLVQAIDSSEAVQAGQVHWTDARSRRADLSHPASLILEH